jgi:hypothetical protein
LLLRLECNPVYQNSGLKPKNRPSQTYCHAVHIVEMLRIYSNLSRTSKFSSKTKVAPDTDLEKGSQQQ